MSTVQRLIAENGYVAGKIEREQQKKLLAPAADVATNSM
jgi:hypothetical protein